MSERWILKDTITLPEDATLFDTEINFTSDNESFVKIGLENNRFWQGLAYYDTEGLFTGVYERTQGYDTTRPGLKTIDFETAPTGNLLTWLQTNATKQQTTVTYEHILKNGHKVQVDSAIRDGNGKKIDTTYSKRAEIVDNLTSTSNTTPLSAKQGKVLNDALAAHTSNNSNPHSVNATQIGLGNVDNTSDMNKPVSTATQTALNTKVDKVEGKSLSTNDFTDSYKSQVDANTLKVSNVQSDWNATEGNSVILNRPAVVDNVESTSATALLSANQGKVLNDRIDSLASIGRFLALWDASTGLPTSEPTSLPYTYHTGDYYRLATIAEEGEDNYIPSGSSYTGEASTAVAPYQLNIGDVFYYDSTQWLRQENGGVSTSQVQDVQINNASTLSSGIAKIVADGTYDSVNNKLATESTVKNSNLNGRVPSAASSTNVLADRQWVTDNAGKIDSISIDGTTQTITNKNVDLPAYPTKASLGLNNVDNTSDANKPISTATQTALDNKVTKTTNANKVYGTDNNGDQTTYDKSSFGKVDTISINSETAIEPDANKNINLTLTKTTVGLGNVDNTSDANKPISTATQTALNAKQNTLIAGDNITIAEDRKTISATDTTYESKTAVSGGSDVSLVTTGEKYTWNNKQNALTTQTAYTEKGSSNKIPQITTNTLGQVTNITEIDVTIPTVDQTYSATSANAQSGVAVAGAISNKLNLSGGNMNGDIGSTSIYPIADSTYNLGSSSKAYKTIYGDEIFQGGSKVALASDIPTVSTSGVTDGTNTYNASDKANYRGALTASTNLNSLSGNGIWTFGDISLRNAPLLATVYGYILQFNDVYKNQLFVGAEAGKSAVYHRRYLTGSSMWTTWEKLANTSDIPTVATTGVTLGSTTYNASDKLSKTENTGISVIGTTKATTTLGGNQLYAPNGIIFGGTAAAAGLVTSGICGINTPTTGGACTKHNLYINYDGANTFSSDRQLVLQAGDIGTHYGNNLYQYCAARGDAVKNWVEAKGYATTSALNSYLPLSAGSSKPLTGDLYFGSSSGPHLSYNSTNKSIEFKF